MADLLVDPVTWTLVSLIVVLSVVFGRLRHEPPLTIAASAVGAGAFLIGIRWATSLNTEAFLAAALTSGGFALWQAAAHGAGARRVAQDVHPEP